MIRCKRELPRTAAHKMVAAVASVGLPLCAPGALAGDKLKELNCFMLISCAADEGEAGPLTPRSKHLLTFCC